MTLSELQGESNQDFADESTDSSEDASSDEPDSSFASYTVEDHFIDDSLEMPAEHSILDDIYGVSCVHCYDLIVAVSKTALSTMILQTLATALNLLKIHLLYHLPAPSHSQPQNRI